METQKQEMLNDLFSLRGAMSLLAVEKEKIDKISILYYQKKLSVRKNAFEMIYFNTSGGTSPAVCYEKPKYKNQYYMFVIDDVEDENKYNKLIQDFEQEKESARKNSKFWRNLFTFNWDIAFDSASQLYYSKVYKSLKKYLENAPEARKKCLDLENKRKFETEPALNKAKSIYQIAFKEYSNVLDERDWQYVDLIIYYLQTGRADSIKEALQQVDRQIQTDAIVGAVKNATNAICKSIQHLESSVCSKLDNIIAQNNIRIEQGAVQNALIAKMTFDSQSLAQDISYIKEYRF